MTTIHTRQLQQYTQDNYNNAHKKTTTIHTRQLQQYAQDNTLSFRYEIHLKGRKLGIK